MEVMQTLYHLRSTDLPLQFVVPPLPGTLPGRRRPERSRGYRDKTQRGLGAVPRAFQPFSVPRQKAITAYARSEPFRNTRYSPKGGLLRPLVGGVCEDAAAGIVCKSHAAAVSEALGENGKPQTGQVDSNRRRHPRTRLGKQWEDWWRLPYVYEKEQEKEGAKPEAVPRSTLQLAGQLWKVMDPPTTLLLGAMLFMVLAAAAELAMPHFISAAIFAVAKNGVGEQLYFERSLHILAGLAVGYGTFAGVRGFLFSLLNNILTQNLRIQLFLRLLKQPIEFYDMVESGQLTSRLGTDCQAVARCLATNFNVALRNSLQCVGGFVYLCILSPQLAGATASVSALLWFFAAKYGKYARKMQRAYQDALADTNQVADEAFSLVRVVRTFGTEDFEGRRYKKNLDLLWDISLRKSTAYLAYLVVNASLFNLTKVMALLLGGTLTMSGQITPQQLTSYVMYVEFVTSASLSVCDQWGNIMESVGASERVMEYLSLPLARQLSEGKTHPHFEGKVELSGVGFQYPSRPNIDALKGINLTLEPGKLVALVGMSGSGKSTLVSMIERHYDPTKGQVRVDGEDLRDLDPQWYRRHLGVVSQETNLFSGTVHDNIAYGIEADRSQVIEAAKSANAHDFIMALPNGYDTKVTDKLLSGGQRQRIALSRALVRDPKILILDEATSALDADSEAAVQKALDRAMRDPNRKRAVIVIAHRLSTVRNADQIIVMERGVITERGTHEELERLRDGTYARLVSKQSGGVNTVDKDMAPHESDHNLETGPAFRSFEEDEEDAIKSTSTANVVGLPGRPACGGPASAGAISEQGQ